MVRRRRFGQWKYLLTEAWGCHSIWESWASSPGLLVGLSTPFESFIFLEDITDLLEILRFSV